MTSPISNTGPSASDKSEHADKVLNLSTARSMLPLVQRIICDVQKAQTALGQLEPEQNRLERQRRSLSWPERARRYQIQEEIADEEHNLQDAMAELEVLGLSIVDYDQGQVGFPTLVNGRKAFFSWRQGEEALRHWHFAGEKVRRTIPSSWYEDEPN